MNTSSIRKAFGLNLQIILVIIATAVIIAVTDNIIDSQRLDEVSQRGQEEREFQFNQTTEEQQALQEAQELHNNQTEQTLQELTTFVTRELERDENVTNPLITEFGRLVNTTEQAGEAAETAIQNQQKEFEMTEQILQKLDQIINNTNSSSGSSTRMVE